MTHMLDWLLRRRCRRPREYQDLLQSPPGYFVTLTLATAVAEHATRVNYGLPPGVDFSEQDEAETRADYERTQKELWSAEEIESMDSDPWPRFHRRDNLPAFPWWREIDGQWVREKGICTWVYAYIPQILSDRLVSLDKRPPEGRVDWIECTSFLSSGARDFARVDLIIETNNSITVDLLETRSLREDSPVWWRYRRV